MASALETSDTPYWGRPRTKVIAGTIGAGIGAGAGLAAAPDLAALTVDLLQLALSEAGMRGLVAVWTMLLAAIGSGGLGYFVRESAVATAAR